MKPHYREASAIVRSKIEAALEEGTSRAQAWKQAADMAWSYGYDVDPPATPASDKIAELRAAGDFRELNRLYMLSNLDSEAQQEARNVVRHGAMARWRAEKSAEERWAESHRIASEQAREAEIEQRAQQILGEQNRAALEKARQQARKEIGANQ